MVSSQLCWCQNKAVVAARDDVAISGFEQSLLKDMSSMIAYISWYDELFFGCWRKRCSRRCSVQTWAKRPACRNDIHHDKLDVKLPPRPRINNIEIIPPPPRHLQQKVHSRMALKVTGKQQEERNSWVDVYSMFGSFSALLIYIEWAYPGLFYVESIWHCLGSTLASGWPFWGAVLGQHLAMSWKKKKHEKHEDITEKSLRWTQWEVKIRVCAGGAFTVVYIHLRYPKSRFGSKLFNINMVQHGGTYRHGRSATSRIYFSTFWSSKWFSWGQCIKMPNKTSSKNTVKSWMTRIPSKGTIWQSLIQDVMAVRMKRFASKLPLKCTSA